MAYNPTRSTKVMYKVSPWYQSGKVYPCVIKLKGIPYYSCNPEILNGKIVKETTDLICGNKEELTAGLQSY